MAIDWRGLKKCYLGSDLSIKEIAQRFGCHPDTIRRRIRKEEWRRGAGTCDGSVIAPACLPSSGTDVTQESHDGYTGDHRSLWVNVRKRLVSGLRNSDAKLGLEELKVAKMAGEVLSSVIKGERLAMGIRPGVEQDGGDDTEEIISEMAAVTVPPGAEEVVDGE